MTPRQMCWVGLIGLLGLGDVLGSGQAAADQVSLVPVRDNTLYQTSFDFTSSGAGIYLFSGYTLRGGGERRAVLAFDVAGAIPAGSTIQAVELTMHVSRNNGSSEPALVHRVLASWGEGASDAGEPGGQGVPAEAGDCTWIHRSFPGTLWGTPGGDFVTTASAATPITGLGFFTWTTSAAMVADVQGWLDQPATNFGWLIRATAPISANARRFDSRENPDPSVRPQLVVTFTPPCIADVDDGTGTGTPDGGVGVEDLLYYLGLYDAGDVRADTDDGSGTGTPDGGVGIEDLLFYLGAYDAGC